MSFGADISLGTRYDAFKVDLNDWLPDKNRILRINITAVQPVGYLTFFSGDPDDGGLPLWSYQITGMASYCLDFTDPDDTNSGLSPVERFIAWSLDPNEYDPPDHPPFGTVELGILLIVRDT